MDGRKIGVFGMTGMGKSTRLKAMLKDRRRVVVFDTQGEYAGNGCAALATNAAELRAHLARGWGGSFSVAYQPMPGQEAAALHGLCVFLLACQEPYKAGADRRPLTFVVEEMDKSFPVSALPRELFGMTDMCNRGRHYGIEVIAASQFPAQVSSTFRANMSEVYCFRLGFHSHRASMLEIFGPAYRDKLAQLAPHEYLRFCDGDVTEGRNELLR